MHNMPSNLIISKSVPGSDGSATSTRLITIHQTQFGYGSDKKPIGPIYIPTTPGTNKDWSVGRQPTKIGDLLRIASTINIKGHLITDETARTTLNGAINNAVTTITLASGTLVEKASTVKPSYIIIGDEIIKYTGVSGNNITGCVRGFGGTTAASHSSGDSVYHPAFHFWQTLIYIHESGGVVDIYYPATVSVTTENTIGSNSVTAASSKAYSGLIKKIDLKELLEDVISPKIDVTIDIEEGIDLI